MLPANAAIADYGGQMADYAAVEDPSTDLSAAAFGQMQNDVAMMKYAHVAEVAAAVIAKV